MPEKEQKRRQTKSKTKKDRDMRFSPFDTAAEFGSRGSPIVDSELYTGTTHDDYFLGSCQDGKPHEILDLAFEERCRAPGNDASRGVPVYSPDSIAGDRTISFRTQLSCSFEW